MAQQHRTDNGSEAAAQVAESADEQGRDAATRVKETAADLGLKVADLGKDGAAMGLAAAADGLRGRVEGMDGVTAGAGTKIADGVEHTAGYLREHDTNEMFGDFRGYVKAHPIQAVAGAVIGGFVLSRIMR